MFNGLIRSLYLYGAVITHRALKYQKVISSTNPVVRLCAINIIRGYKTISQDAAMVLAEFPPLEYSILTHAAIRCADIGVPDLFHPGPSDLQCNFPTQVHVSPLGKKHNKYFAGDSWVTKAQLKADFRLSIQSAWQARWDTAPHGRDTYKWFPNIEARSQSGFLPDFYSVQFITTFGFFSDKQFLWSNVESPNCICGAIQTADHLLTVCNQPVVSRLRELYPVSLYDTSPTNLANLKAVSKELFVLRESLRGTGDPTSLELPNQQSAVTLSLSPTELTSSASAENNLPTEETPLRSMRSAVTDTMTAIRRSLSFSNFAAKMGPKKTISFLPAQDPSPANHPTTVVVYPTPPTSDNPTITMIPNISPLAPYSNRELIDDIYNRIIHLKHAFLPTPTRRDLSPTSLVATATAHLNTASQPVAIISEAINILKAKGSLDGAHPYCRIFDYNRLSPVTQLLVLIAIKERWFNFSLARPISELFPYAEVSSGKFTINDILMVMQASMPAVSASPSPAEQPATPTASLSPILDSPTSRHSTPLLRDTSFSASTPFPTSQVVPSGSTLLNPYFRIIKRDLFEMSDDYALAHCVAEDLAMYRGIAAEFVARFGGREILRSQRKKVGEVAVLATTSKTIFYLITKRNSNGKPTLATLQKALTSLKAECGSRKIPRVAMPQIGCGLDKLDWGHVKEMIRNTFSGSGVEVVICIP